MGNLVPCTNHREKGVITKTARDEMNVLAWNAYWTLQDAIYYCGLVIEGQSSGSKQH